MDYGKAKEEVSNWTWGESKTALFQETFYWLSRSTSTFPPSFQTWQIMWALWKPLTSGGSANGEKNVFSILIPLALCLQICYVLWSLVLSSQPLLQSCLSFRFQISTLSPHPFGFRIVIPLTFFVSLDNCINICVLLTPCPNFLKQIHCGKLLWRHCNLSVKSVFDWSLIYTTWVLKDK